VPVAVSDERVEEEPAPRPVPVSVPPPEPAPVWVRTKPWGTVTVDGRTTRTEDRGLALPPGRHALDLVAHDGRRHRWTIDVVAGSNNAFCWDYDREAPCSP
jgi:hypothetical protein